MPIECAIAVELIDQDRFHQLDHVVMGHAFAVHNAIGRFCDERIYQETIARRCRDCGLSAQVEVPLRATHRDFKKLYFIDMLIERSAIYELKTVGMLSDAHHAQVINYLLLSGVHHGKLINLRTQAVQSRFVSTHLSGNERKSFTVKDERFAGDSAASGTLRDTLCALIEDWGTCLDVSLYRAAILHFMSRVGGGVGQIDICIDGHVAGTQPMCVLDASTAWHLSTINQCGNAYEEHLMRLLQHTSLKRLHWINLGRHDITLVTLDA